MDLEDLKRQDTQYIKQKWEMEANIRLTEDDWDSTNQQIFSNVEETWVEKHIEIL